MTGPSLAGERQNVEPTALDERVAFAGTVEEREAASWTVRASVIHSNSYRGSGEGVRLIRISRGVPVAPHTPELEALQTLDGQFVSQVHDRYFPELYRYAQFRIGDSATAEDVVSETFLRLIEALRTGRGPQRHLRGWLFGTARHLVDDHFRRLYARAQEPLPENLAGDEHDPVQLSEEDDTRRGIRAALARLTSDQQDVLALRFHLGLSLAEVAGILGKKANAVKALQFRALTALRKAMEDTP